MNDAELRTYAESLDLVAGVQAEADEEFKAFAFYREFPGCLAFGRDLSSAVAELSRLIVPFIQPLAAADGLPRPNRMQMQAIYLSYGPVFAGDVGDFNGVIVQTTATTLSGTTKAQKTKIAA